MSANNEHDTAPQIEPEDGYDEHWPHGLLRCGSAPSDRLVRLADIVRWLRRNRPEPFNTAVDEVCNAIDGDSIMHVYFVQKEDWARPVAEPTAWSEYFDDAEERDLPWPQRAARQCVKSLRGTWQGDPMWLAKAVNDPDYAPHEYDPFTEIPFEYSERKGNGAAAYAIRIAKAHALWGWGAAAQAEQQADAVVSLTAPATVITADDVKDWPRLVQYRHQINGLPKGQIRPAWPQEHIDILAAWVCEDLKQNGQGAAGRVAAELGMHRSRIAPVLKAGGYLPNGVKEVSNSVFNMKNG